MGLRAKWQVIIGVFALCWLLYFLIPCLGNPQCLGFISDLFATEAFNFIFLTVLFLTISVVATDVVEYFYMRVRRLPWFRPRLGEVLVQKGFITKEELAEALDEQRLRIGDVLLESGRCTHPELEHAADYLRSRDGMRMGEALIELGYASEKDVTWALKRSNRKLGEVLVEQGLLTEYDLRRTLGRMWYGRFRGL